MMAGMKTLGFIADEVAPLAELDRYRAKAMDSRSLWQRHFNTTRRQRGLLPAHPTAGMNRDADIAYSFSVVGNLAHAREVVPRVPIRWFLAAGDLPPDRRSPHY